MYNTDYEIRNVFYQSKLNIKDGDIRLQAGFSEKKFGANGLCIKAATEQYEETQASIVSLAHQQRFGKLNSVQMYTGEEDRICIFSTDRNLKFTEICTSEIM
jgi:hypothetical protein